MQDQKQLWNEVLLEMELIVSKPNFATWFKNTTIIKIEDGVVFIGVPNDFVKDWLKEKYHRTILKSLRGIYEGIRSLEYTIVKDLSRLNGEKRKEVDLSLNKELPLQEHLINKEDNLNPRYTFENFIVGSFNQLAHAAAQAILTRPGVQYNPFFVYGNTGLGKTHLIQAIGNSLKNSYSNKKVFYTSLEKFSVDYVNAMQVNRINAFKEKYRKYDVIVMDDLQFISTKEKTQDELFHLFNALYEDNKQIIFSSDRHPKFIPNLEDRLRSRFEMGMTIDINQPELESRIEILKRKFNEANFYPEKEILEFIAQAIDGNIRELEGIANLVICQSQVKNKFLTIPEIKPLLKNAVKPKRNLAIKDVIKIVADFYNIEEESIYEKSRKKEVVKPRQVAMFILREDFNISYPSIGEKLGGRDHTTVIHSYDKIKNDLEVDSLLLREIEQIRTSL